MSLLLSFAPHTLRFKFEAGTSRGVLTSKITYVLTVRDIDYPEVYGVGEAGPLKGLSMDDIPEFDRLKLEIAGWKVDDLVNRLVPSRYPSIRFAVEAALIDFKNGGRRIYFDNPFTRGEQPIKINGLIWMGQPEFMEEQIERKL